jgi:triosephosphate isomerase
VRGKALAARRAGLVPIVCVGETLAERDAGVTLDVLSRQIEGSLDGGVSPATHVIAYEPVWAIGTGRTPTLEQIQEVHAHLRAQLVAHHGAAAAGVRILYGGSVKPANAAEILALPDVDGALVGGASLKAVEFLAIVGAAG